MVDQGPASHDHENQVELHNAWSWPDEAQATAPSDSNERQSLRERFWQLFEGRQRSTPREQARKKDQETLSKLDYKTRSEFYIEVAERFREAGDRLLSVVSGTHKPSGITRSHKQAPDTEFLYESGDPVGDDKDYHFSNAEIDLADFGLEYNQTIELGGSSTELGPGLPNEDTLVRNDIHEGINQERTASPEAQTESAGVILRAVLVLSVAANVIQHRKIKKHRKAEKGLHQRIDLLQQATKKHAFEADTLQRTLELDAARTARAVVPAEEFNNRLLRPSSTTPKQPERTDLNTNTHTVPDVLPVSQSPNSTQEHTGRGADLVSRPRDTVVEAKTELRHVELRHVSDAFPVSSSEANVAELRARHGMNFERAGTKIEEPRSIKQTSRRNASTNARSVSAADQKAQRTRDKGVPASWPSPGIIAIILLLIIYFLYVILR